MNNKWFSVRTQLALLLGIITIVIVVLFVLLDRAAAPIEEDSGPANQTGHVRLMS